MAAAQRLTTTEQHETEFGNVFHAGSGAWSYTQCRRHLGSLEGIGGGILENLSAAVTLPQLVESVCDENQLDLISSDWRRQCKFSASRFCQMPLAQQTAALQTGPAGAYTVQIGYWPLCISSSKQLDIGAINEIVPFVSALGLAAYLQSSFDKDTSKRRRDVEVIIFQKLDDVDVGFADFCLAEGAKPTCTMNDQKEIQKMVQKFKLDHEKYKTVKSGPDFYKMMSNESDEVKVKWLKHNIAQGLIDTKQIPKVVKEYYTKLGVVFPL